jgi:hypothetical protein
VAQRKAWKFIRNHPGRFLELVWEKQKRFWSPVSGAPGYGTGWNAAVSAVAWVAVILPALVGLLRYRRQLRETAVWMLPVVYVAVLHAVFPGSVRYRDPIMPLVMIPAGLTWSVWLRNRVSDPAVTSTPQK